MWACIVHRNSRIKLKRSLQTNNCVHLILRLEIRYIVIVSPTAVGDTLITPGPYQSPLWSGSNDETIRCPKFRSHNIPGVTIVMVSYAIIYRVHVGSRQRGNASTYFVQVLYKQRWTILDGTDIRQRCTLTGRWVKE